MTDKERRERYRAATLIVELREQLADAQAQLAAKDAEIAGAFVAAANRLSEIGDDPTASEAYNLACKDNARIVRDMTSDSARQAMEQVKQGAVEPYKNALRHVEEFLGVHWESAQKEVFADNNFGWSMIAIEAIKKAMEQRIAEAMSNTLLSVIAKMDECGQVPVVLRGWVEQCFKQTEAMANRAKAEGARKGETK